jgi:hypothetical protein
MSRHPLAFIFTSCSDSRKGIITFRDIVRIYNAERFLGPAHPRLSGIIALSSCSEFSGGGLRQAA